MLARLFLACGLFAALPAVSPAALITYTETVTASGSLGRAAYTDALVTLTQTADTAGVITDGVVRNNPPLTSTVAIAGLGTFSFTTPAVTFGTPSINFGGVANGTGSSALVILGLTNSAFAGYNLQTAIGPLTGNPSFNPSTGFATTGGNLIIGSTTGQATFQAVVTPTATAVPAPAGLLLAGLGAPALGLLRVRRRAVA